MTTQQIAVAGLFLAVLLAGLIVLIASILKEAFMPVDPRVASALTQIETSVAALPAQTAAAVAAAQAAADQNATDTANAVQAAADALKGAVGA